MVDKSIIGSRTICSTRKHSLETFDVLLRLNSITRPLNLIAIEPTVDYQHIKAKKVIKFNRRAIEFDHRKYENVLLLKILIHDGVRVTLE